MRPRFRLAAAGLAVVAALALAGCAVLPPATSGSTGSAGSADPAHPPAPVPTGAAAEAVAATVRARYEDVRDKNYAAACAMYSEKFAEKFAELAGVDGASCVAAHVAGQKNADEYQATAEKQGRAGLTPFFYVPSAISIDTSLIKIEDGGTTAFLEPDSVTSLDPTEFEDGTGQLPSWLEGMDYLKLIDGKWTFIFMTEQ